MHDATKPDVRGLETEAYGQHGYFRVAQTREHGISSQLLSHHVRQGRFDQVRRGLYRLRGFPSAEHDEMREKWMAVGTKKAVLSHQSALALLELSDVIPDAAPPARRAPTPRPATPARHRDPHSPRRGGGQLCLARGTSVDRPCADAGRCCCATPARAGRNGRAAGAWPRSAHGR